MPRFCLTAMEDGTGAKQPENRKRLRLIKQGRVHLLKGGTAEIPQGIGAFGVREAQTPARNFKQNSGSLAGCRESVVLAVPSVKGMYNCNKVSLTATMQKLLKKHRVSK